MANYYYISKIPYYIKSTYKLLHELDYKMSLFYILLKKKKVLYFKNNLKFNIISVLDCLIIKETIFDDAYQIAKIKEPTLIIDVGGGIGEFSIFTAQKFPNAKKIIFEPDPIFFDILLHNIKLNKVKNIQALNIAIGKKSNKIFYLQKNHAKSSFFAKNGGFRKIKIKKENLDKFITQNVDLLKIDCEGSEIEVLKSIPRNKMKRIKKIVLEYHNHLVNNCDLRIIKLLELSEFRIKKIPDPYNKNIGYIYAKNVSFN